MADGPVTVEVGGFQITSNHETADDMVRALTPPDKGEAKTPKVLGEPEKTPLQKAASELGKEGGKAAAQARKIKPIPDQKPAQDASPDPVKATENDTTPEGEAGTQDTAGGQADEFDDVRDPDIKRRLKRAAAREAEAKRVREEALREREYWRAEAERARADFEARSRQTQPPEQERPKSNQPPFKPEEFEDYEQYLDARDDWRRQEWEAETQERAAVQAYAAQLNHAVSGFNGRIQEAFGDEFEAQTSEEVRKLRPSFVLRDGEQVTALTIVADEIVSSEQAPQLMAYLSENPDVFQRLATLPSPQAVQREMAKLEAKVEAATTGAVPATSKAISKAPPPVKPVTGSPQAANPFEVSDDMDTTEWIKRRQAQEAAQRPRR